MGDFPIAEAQLLALFMQSLTHGVHLVTFASCVRTQLRSSSARKPMNWLWLSVAVSLFIVATIDLSFNLYHNIFAFVFFTGQGGAAAVFDELSSWVEVVRSVLFYLGGSISDIALMYRCWVICGRKWTLLILQLLLFLSALACASVILYYTAILEATSTIPDENKLRPFLTAYFSTTLCTNVICTSLIVFHIWKVNRRSSEFFTHSFRGSGRVDFLALNRIFIESALLYTSSVVITFAALLSGSNVNYALSDISQELAGVSFDLIIIRISRGISIEQTEEFTATLRLPQAMKEHTVTQDTRAVSICDTQAVDTTSGALSYSLSVTEAERSEKRYDICEDIADGV